MTQKFTQWHSNKEKATILKKTTTTLKCKSVKLKVILINQTKHTCTERIYTYISGKHDIKVSITCHATVTIYYTVL